MLNWYFLRPETVADWVAARVIGAVLWLKRGRAVCRGCKTEITCYGAFTREGCPVCGGNKLEVVK